MKNEQGRLIRVPIAGAVLFLTPEEFVAGIRRGKHILRAEKRRKRAKQEQEAERHHEKG